VAVDAVNAVIDIEAGDIEPPPAFGTRIHADFIHGLGKVNGKFVIVLDVQRVLDVKEFNDAVAAVDGNSVPPAELERE